MEGCKGHAGEIGLWPQERGLRYVREWYGTVDQASSAPPLANALVERLNKKCLHFWRLDAIWGCSPSNWPPVAAVDTPRLPPAVAQPVGGSGGGGAKASQVSEPRPETGGRGPVRLGSDADNDGDDDGQEAPAHRSSRPRARGASSQRGRLRGEGLKRSLEASEGRREAWDEKRIKVEADVQIHRIDSERATAERVAEIQARSNEQVAEIQARSSEKMAEMQQQTMRMQMQMMEGFFKVMQSRDAAS